MDQNTESIIMIIIIIIAMFYGLVIGVKGCYEMRNTSNKIVKFFNTLFVICIIAYIANCIACLFYFITIIIDMDSLQIKHLIGFIGSLSYYTVLYSLLYTAIARLYYAFKDTLYEISPKSYKIILFITTCLTTTTTLNFMIMQFARFVTNDPLINLTLLISLVLILCYIILSWSIIIIFGCRLYKLMLTANIENIGIISENTVTEDQLQITSEEQCNVNTKRLKLSNINTNSNSNSNSESTVIAHSKMEINTETPTPDTDNDHSDFNLVQISVQHKRARKELNEDQMEILHKISKYICLAFVQFSSTFMMFTAHAIIRILRIKQFGGFSLLILLDCIINISCLYLTFIFATDIYNKSCRCWSNICDKCIKSHAIRRINNGQ